MTQVKGRARPNPMYPREEVSRRVDAFHEAYYYAGLWRNTTWMGVPAWKCPLDLWVYQEIIHQTRPTLIIECGTAHGGTALYMAHLFDTMGDTAKTSRIVSVDIAERPNMPRHPRIEYLLGSSTDESVVARVRERVRADDRVMVILDSLHSRDHVFAELRAYWAMVSPGCYLIVEDSNINGHPVWTDYEPDAGPGPFEAVADFMNENDRFEIDASRERFMMTFNPSGYLRRKA
ncbi:MAG: class I SAM-dependent methyltransferase [Phycisphaerales bacterium]|nr:class I SAM-dependent methyltransferase [Phycisphaerales bacterium]